MPKDVGKAPEPVYHTAMDTHGLAERVGELLRTRGLTLGFAESCTGGLAGDCITDVPGSSDYFAGSIVAYSNAVKQQVLGVRGETLAQFGAVSPQCAAEMAQGARRALGVDIAVSITGIAGPTGDSADKPVGLTYLHLAADQAEVAREERWHGNRRGNKERSTLAALDLLVSYLEGRTP